LGHFLKQNRLINNDEHFAKNYIEIGSKMKLDQK